MAVPNNMHLEDRIVYGYPDNEMRLPARLKHLSLNLETFIQYLKDNQEGLKGNRYGEVLELGPGTDFKGRLFTDFVQEMLDGWLVGTVGIGPEAVKIGGNFYSIPADLNAFWTRLENLAEMTPIDDLLG